MQSVQADLGDGSSLNIFDASARDLCEVETLLAVNKTTALSGQSHHVFTDMAA
jgi:hypothetical protein